MIAYKLVRKRKDGSLGSLFIGRRDRLPIGKWLKSECIPTKGYAVRQGWHCTKEKHAPHLSETDRVWVLVEIEDYIPMERPESQGGTWFIADRMRIIKEIIDDGTTASILSD